MPNSKIKILRVITRMNIGGPAVQIKTLMQELPEGDFQQLLVHGKCDLNEIDYLESNEIRLTSNKIGSLGRSISLIQDLSALVALWRLIRRFKPDIVHTHTFKAGLLGRLATLPLSRRPIVIHTYHGHLLHGYFGNLKTRLVIYVERFLAFVSDELIAVGEKVKLDLLENGIGDPAKYRVIRPGFNLRKTEEVNRLELGINDSDFVCSWVGRLTDIKMPHRILKLAEELKNREITQIKFVIIGDGELRRDLEREAFSNSLPLVFLGWRVNALDYISMSDILILTSKNEGTPISIIEAQLLGKPVIATDVGSVNEVMIPGETGYSMDFDIHAFCEKILYLKENSIQYAKFQSKAKEFASEEFSTVKFISNHTKLYKDSLGF